MSDNQESFDLETIYDAEIAPLMTKIIGICKEHKLPMFATFMYAADADDGHDFCTTNLMFEKERPVTPELRSLERTIRYGSGVTPLRMRVTKGDGSVEDTVILP